MHLSIDSSTEPLDDVLRVVGALYGVELGIVEPAAADDTAAAAEAPAVGAPRSSSRRSRAAKRGPRNAPRTSEVRSWAQANGFAVSDRGRIPAHVFEAYAAAQ